MGIAITDPLMIGASGLTTISAHEVLDFLAGYFEREEVECIVVGKPVQMNNTGSESLPLVEQFVASLKKKFPDKKIALLDERFTSKMAVRAMIEGGMKKSRRRIKGNIDMMSAAILLQSFLEQERNKNKI